MSCDCNTLVVGEAGVQGPQGLAGINGTNGTNGLNAFTTTSASFVQPALNVSVTFSVVENRWIAVGQTIYISNAGFYRVTSVGGSPYSSVTAVLVKTDGVVNPSTVSSGLKVSPSSSALYTAPLSELQVTGTSSLDGAVTVNTSNAAVNFVVKGDTSNNLLVANGGLDCVGINILSPAATLDVAGTLKVLSAAEFRSGATVNASQADSDFSVRTQTSTNTLYVDANENRVGIGTNVPAKLLDVNGAAEMNSLLVNPGGIAANPSFQVYGTNSTRPITVLSTSSPVFNGVGIFKDTPAVALDVVGAATVTGATILGSTLTVAGDLSVDTNVLKVDTANNRIGVNKTSPAVALDVVGATALSSTLDVTGTTTLSSTLDVTGDLSVDTNVLKVDTANNRIGVNKTSPAVALDVVGAATVSGATILSSTLAVTGAATLSSTLDVTGNLSVSINTLKVDTSTSRVGINQTTPTVALDVVGAISRGSPVTKTANFSLATTENWIIVNNAAGTTTVTLPGASTAPGREVFIKTTQAQAVVSGSNDVVPLIGGSAGTPILSGTAGKWATLVSDGADWVIMAGT
jgi:hypothetical protein